MSAIVAAASDSVPAIDRHLSLSSDIFWRSHFGVVDVLVYNAVSFSQGQPSTADPATLTRDFTVNVAGALAAAKAVLPGMRQRKSGTLLFTGGGWALYPDPEFTSMGLSKGALRTLVQLLAKELEAAVSGRAR